MKELSIPRDENEFSFEKEYISPEPHYRKLPPFCIDFYGNRSSLIISKLGHTGIILVLRYDQTVR